MNHDAGPAKAVEGLLIEAHEQERRQIARQLHDDIGQRLAVLTMDLDALASRLPSPSAETVQRIRELSDQTLALAKDIQALSHRLLPSTLEYLGLVSASSAFCKDMAAENVEIAFTHEGVPARLAAPIALSIFRVLQEAVSNVARHAGVARAAVRLRGSADDIQLEVVDEGRGFAPDAALETGAPGLVGMRERMRLIGGELVIQSGHGAGTAIRARVPLTRTT